MKKLYDYGQLIEKNAPFVGGVFTTSDLAILTGTSEKTLLPRKIKQLVDAKILTKFMRGFYVHIPTLDMRTLSQKICPRSYVSMENILADRLVIGSIPQNRVTAVKVGWPRTYQGPNLLIEHISIKEELFFGFESKKNVHVANPEKAYLDCLYFYMLGRPLMFSPYEDVNYTRLDIGLISKYLEKYNNEKFVSFVRGLLDEHA